MRGVKGVLPVDRGKRVTENRNNLKKIDRSSSSSSIPLSLQGRIPLHVDVEDIFQFQALERAEECDISSAFQVMVGVVILEIEGDQTEISR